MWRSRSSGVAPHPPSQDRTQHRDDYIPYRMRGGDGIAWPASTAPPPPHFCIRSADAWTSSSRVRSDLVMCTCTNARSDRSTNSSASGVAGHAGQHVCMLAQSLGARAQDVIRPVLLRIEGVADGDGHRRRLQCIGTPALQERGHAPEELSHHARRARAGCFVETQVEGPLRNGFRARGSSADSSAQPRTCRNRASAALPSGCRRNGRGPRPATRASM